MAYFMEQFIEHFMEHFHVVSFIIKRVKSKYILSSKCSVILYDFNVN